MCRLFRDDSCGVFLRATSTELDHVLFWIASELRGAWNVLYIFERAQAAEQECGNRLKRQDGADEDGLVIGAGVFHDVDSQQGCPLA